MHFIQPNTPTSRTLYEKIQGTIRLYWVPGHAGMQGNERANRLARETAIRAPCNRIQPPRDPIPPKPITLKDIRHNPEAYPKPHPHLTKEEQVLVRQAQTGTLLTPARLALYQRRPLPRCLQCQGVLDQCHLFGECNKGPGEETILRLSRFEDQTALIVFIKNHLQPHRKGDQQAPDMTHPWPHRNTTPPRKPRQAT